MKAPRPGSAQWDGMLQGIAAAVDRVLNPYDGPPELQFVLLVSRRTAPNALAPVSCLWNGTDECAVLMMKEIVARAEGRYVETPGHA